MINTRRPKKCKKYKKCKNKTKRKRYIGGGKCNHREFTEMVSKEIVNYWGDQPWNSTPLTEYFEIQESRRGEKIAIQHHPVILYIITKYKKPIVDALQFYCTEKNNNIGNVEIYKDILQKYNQFIKTNGPGHLSEFIVQMENEWPKNPNKLQPNMFHLFMLHYHINDPLYRQLNSLQDPGLSKQEKWKTYISLFTGLDPSNRFTRLPLPYPLLDVFALGSGHDMDLDRRAGIIAERCIRNRKIKRVHTMDGHGRFICKLIEQLLHRDPHFFINRQEFDIFVYDIDKETHLWHQSTMPEGSSKFGNIFDFFDEDPDLSESLYYFNFSGLQKQHDRVLRSFEIVKMLEILDNIVVSFYTKRGADVSDDDSTTASILIAKILSVTHKPNILRKVTDREDFVTIGTGVGLDYSTILRK